MQFPARCMSQYQSDTAKAIIRMAKMYRGEKNNDLRRDYGKMLLMLAQKLVDQPDAGGMPKWPVAPPNQP